MKASEKKAIESWAARLSDAKLEEAYYDAVYDSLGSQVEEMYARDYDMADIRERISLEKYQDEKAGLLEELCTARGIRIWEERKCTHHESDDTHPTDFISYRFNTVI